MKKVLFGILVSIILASCSSSKKIIAPLPSLPVQNILKNDVDSMSYALGMNLGADFANNLKAIPGGKSNADLIIKAFTTALKGDSTILNKDSAQLYFREYISKKQNEDNESKRASGEKFLNENRLKEGVQATASGLQYMVLKSGDGAKPNAEDTVKVHYTGTLIDGTVFDSSIERGEPIEFPLNGVIPGWTEGVQLMTVGSKYKLFIPYNLGYGERGVPQAGILPYSPLIFEVELLDIKKFVPTIPQMEPVKINTTKKK